MRYTIGIDVGGTFTDIVVATSGAGAQIVTAKATTTPGDQSDGVLHGISLAAQRLGLTADALLHATSRIVHGTTVATNALLEGKTARVGMLTTEGHRDVIEMREGLKPDRYNLRMTPPAPLVPRRLRLPVRERMRADGVPGNPAGPGLAGPRHRPDGRRRRASRGDLLPPRMAQSHPRAPGRPSTQRSAAGGIRHDVVRRAATDQGVRALLHHRGQRRGRAGDPALSEPPSRAPDRSRIQRRAPRHAVPRRRRLGSRGHTAGGRHRAVRPSRGRRGGGGADTEGPDGSWRNGKRDRLRHGWYVDRHCGGTRRPADTGGRQGGRQRADRVAQPGYCHLGGWRRIHRQTGQLGTADRRTRERRSRSRARVLRPGRHSGDGDGCQPGAWVSRSGELSRRPAKPGCGRGDFGGGEPRNRVGHRGRRRRWRHSPPGEQPDGGRSACVHGPSWGRSAAIHAAGLRRRRRPARHRGGGRTWHDPRGGSPRRLGDCPRGAC